MLPSPIIEGTLPAFYFIESGTVKITVPFSVSRAVNKNEIKGFQLKLKYLQGSEIIYTTSTTTFDFVTQEALFSFEVTDKFKEAFSAGSFYKAQLAFIDTNGVVGYFSTVGIIKCTKKPLLSIVGLSTSKNNIHGYTYTGVYSQQDRDPTEKVYSYRFIIKDNQDQIIEDSGYLIHNSSNDTEYFESSDVFTYTYDLTQNDKYTITYMVKTNNGLEVESPSYKIIQKSAVGLESIKKIYPVVNNDHGMIEIFFNVNPNPKNMDEYYEMESDRQNEEYVKGVFILSRSTEEYQYQNWETIVEFSLFSQLPSTQTWKDFTIEQGKKYKYSIQQYSKSNQLYSERLISNEVIADFEDSFLYDGNRQLKIKFNPKVSSFKKNLFEAKVDTLGSKYPFIFRNGQVEYKEFPISGLISYLMDDQSFFYNNLEQFVSREREFVEIYQPFTWKTHINQIVEKNLQRQQYEKSYKVLYIWDDASQEYIKWLNYLEIQFNTGEEKYNKYNKFENYDRYFDPNKKYYLKTKQEINSIDIDSLRLKTTDLTSQNISLERDFKMEVLNWLTNGQPKLFRSPTEGNFIVRLMNVSLTPEDKLGRMLHSFNSTAYEIADFTYDILNEYGFLNTQYFKKTYFKVQTLPLVTDDKNYYLLSSIKYIEKNNVEGIYYADGSLMPTSTNLEFVEITDVVPGTKFKINGETIEIGQSGFLKIEIPIFSLEVLSPFEGTVADPGKVTVGYYTDIDDSFSYISNVELEERCGRQYIGEHDNIITKFSDRITQPVHYYLVRSYERELQDIDTIPSADTHDVLPLYKYTSALGMNQLGTLYKQIWFESTEFYDSLKEESLTRANEFRTSTNDALYSKSDFSLKVNNKEIYQYSAQDDNFILVEDPIYKEGIYFEKENIEYIIDLLNTDENKYYLSNRSYSLFSDLWKIILSINSDSAYVNRYKPIFEEYHNLVKYTIEIQLENDEVKVIDLFDTGYYELIDINKIISYKTSPGVFSDFTYTVQITNYDISRNTDLKDLKNKLDACKDILSYDRAQDYSGRKQLSIYEQLINSVRNGFSSDTSYNFNGNIIKFKKNDSYKTIYESYLTKLEDYVDTLIEFNNEGVY